MGENRTERRMEPVKRTTPLTAYRILGRTSIGLESDLCVMLRY